MGLGESKQLSAEDLEQLKQRTDFSGQEILDWYEHFQGYDTCSDGTMDRSEFQQMYTKLYPDGDATEFSGKKNL